MDDKHGEILARLDQKTDGIIELLRKHDRDIDSLKSWRAWTTGVGTAAFAFLSWMGYRQ